MTHWCATIYQSYGEKLRILFCVMFIAVFVADCAGPATGGRGSDRGGPPRDGAAGPQFSKKATLLGGRGGDRFFGEALALKNEGNCEDAVPLLRPMAEMGYGYEIAQYHLGDCLLILAANQSDAGKAETHQALGLHWLLKAGHSNNADAQGKLAALYFDGDVVSQSRIDAGKWYLLYMRNPIQLKVGAVPLEPGLERSLLDELRPLEWVEATVQADAWQVVTQEINRPVDRGPLSGEKRRGGDDPRRLTEGAPSPAEG